MCWSEPGRLCRRVGKSQTPVQFNRARIIVVYLQDNLPASMTANEVNGRVHQRPGNASAAVLRMHGDIGDKPVGELSRGALSAHAADDVPLLYPHETQAPRPGLLAAAQKGEQS